MVTEQRPLVVRLLGTALQSPGQLPGLLAGERRRIENQVRVAHWIGEMAVTMGRKHRPLARAIRSRMILASCRRKAHVHIEAIETSQVSPGNCRRVSVAF